MLSFIKNFEAEVYVQYQQMGSKLRDTVRTKNNVADNITDFMPVGKGIAGGNCAECELHDYFAGDWVDKLDELKTNIKEQQVAAKAGAYALGRKTDELIINQLATSGIYADADTDGLTKSKIFTAFETLEEAGVPDDGQRYAIVGWKQWVDLLRIEEFANADYVGDDQLPWKGTQAKRWLGTLWIPHSGLPKSGNVRHCFWYHKTAVGHAIGSEVKTGISWHKDRVAHFVNNIMSQGACLIDATHVVCIPCVEQCRLRVPDHSYVMAQGDLALAESYVLAAQATYEGDKE